MQRYVVPEAGLKAAAKATTSLGGRLDEQDVESILEAFIRWQSEKTPVPTEEQIAAYAKDLFPVFGLEAATRSKIPGFAEWWVRRMYLAPKPEVPEEINDLLWQRDDLASMRKERFDQVIIEAYRRGHKAGAQGGAMKGRDAH